MKLSAVESRNLAIKKVASRRSNDLSFARIIDEYKSGKSMNRLAFEHDTNDAHIKRILTANNVPIRGQKLASRTNR